MIAHALRGAVRSSVRHHFSAMLVTKVVDGSRLRAYRLYESAASKTRATVSSPTEKRAEIMKCTAGKNHRTFVAVAFGAMLLASVGTARAHEDPAGCFETGPAIIVSVFRADGVTGVVGNVSQCETIKYRATLQKANDLDSICAFSGGTFSLTTPDGVVHTIDSNVPCIGGNTGLEGCLDAVNNEVSTQFSYTVNTADVVGGLITAT